MNNTLDRAAGILATSSSHPTVPFEGTHQVQTPWLNVGRPKNLDIAENFTRINSQRTWMS